MASTNQSPFYQRAEEDFLNATTDEERIECLEIMMREVPKHKSSENMRRNLTNRYKKLKKGIEKRKKAGKSTNKESIKKSEIQSIIIGFPNTGKSSLFNQLTNTKSIVSEHPFSTFKTEQGISKFEDIKMQILDSPPFPNEDKGLINSADSIIILARNFEQIKNTLEKIWKNRGKKIIVYNKSEELDEKELRKISATLKSKFKDYSSYILSPKNPEKEKIQELKKEIFEAANVIRIYTKEPKKEPTKTPLILKENSTPRDVAEKILKGMSKKIKQIKIWGPSSKFLGQSVGQTHILKDKDIIEIHTL
jgi:ribosome-interacting GTPase 1